MKRPARDGSKSQGGYYADAARVADLVARAESARDDRFDPDPREEKLQQWVRARLNELRRALATAEQIADNAEKAAELARQGSHATGAVVSYPGPDGMAYGLPDVTLVYVGEFEVEVDVDGALTVDSPKRISVEPTSGNSIRVRTRKADR
jgi:hypothetical protein